MKFVGLILSTLLFASAYCQDLSVEKIWKQYQFYAKGVSGFRSMNDGEHFTKRMKHEGSDCITKHAFKNPEAVVEVMVNLSSLKMNGAELKIDDYEFNDNESKILFTTNTKSIYRRSFTADYYLYDLASKNLSSLDEAHSPQQLATYSPDGKQVAFVHANDLFVKDIASGKVTALTNDGKTNNIINGTTDWVYEEEFAITQGFTWSPDSKHIAYLRFDESKVKEFPMTYFGELYPDLYQFKYPKAGEDNSKVEPFIVEVASLKKQKVNLGEFEYLPRMKWSSTENALVFQTLNRHQSHLKYHVTRMENGSWIAKTFFEEKSKTYVDIDDNLLILKDGKTILRTSEMDGFNHIYAVGFDGTNRQITKGSWDVIEFLGIDEKGGTIYYASAEKGPQHKGVYRIDMSGKKKMAITAETGSNSATFSTGMKYFVKSASTANTPPVYTLCDNKGKELFVLEDNKDLKERLASYKLSPKEFMQIEGATTTLNAWMIKPANFDPNKKYPVYVTIYGGPGSGTVKDSWGGNDYLYHQLLAQKGYIVFSVDPRGTGMRGADFKKCTYLQLGKFETEDFIAAAKNLGKLSYVDANRIGIQGWSYGGFMSSLCITKGSDVFKMAIAVAPVTTWRYYDNIYTERYMQTPSENAEGYDQNSPINFVDQLKGKYFLIHGSTDDNVHYQNTMDMISALVKADKQFDLFIYPNKNHGIYGGNTRNHLFNMMFNYTLDNL